MAPTGLSRLTAGYNKLAAFNVEDLFVRKREPGPRRTVFVNENLPEDCYDKKGRVKPQYVYPTSQVLTSKYTIITFLPRNLLEQFRRVANVFFLGIAILQFFPKFSTISPGLVILPLLAVLGITAAKDGYEDIKRHQSDRSVNHTPVRVLTGGGWANPNVMAKKSRTFVRGVLPSRWSKKKSANVNEKNTPGEPTDSAYDDVHEEDTVHGHGDDSQPHWRKTIWEDVRVGDFVKLKDNESIPADILICATSGDENVAFVETKNLDGETNLKSRNAAPALTHLRSARACADVHNRFRIEADRPDVNMYKLNAKLVVDAGKERDGVVAEHPMDMQMMLLRGTVLRNTAWVIGVVVYTGGDTRIVMNSGGTPSKRSKVERQMNPQVFINLLILALMAIVCAIVDSVLEKRDYPRSAPWLYDDNQSDNNPSINGLITWAFALITFQNIVPISLYISIEFVRTCQAAFIYFDSEIMYEKTGQATLARSWNLSDDLGQIEYIFSDKTGTLTQNSMVFRKCSIAGKVYNGDPEDVLEKEPLVQPIPSAKKDTPSSSGSSSGHQQEKERDIEAVRDPLTVGAVKLSAQVLHHFTDQELTADLAASLHADPNSPGATHARSLNGFFSVLALCHTVLTGTDPLTGAIEYKAQSPDEAALVQAAADVGYVFRGRDGDVMLLQTPFGEGVERYQLLNILEFTSARKRMSVVLRKMDEQDGRIFLLCKGADNVVFERLKEGGDELKAETERHLGEFASEGLRTLTLAYTVVQEDEYASWSERYNEAIISMDHRDEKIEAVSDELEHDLRLLGATAIEDRLQDGVPETIADLKRAGIKIWVATGDKLETAIAIGHSTNLIGRESNIIVIRGNSHGRVVYDQMVRAADEFFPEARLLEDKNKENAAAQTLPRYSQDQQAGDKAHQLRRMDTGLSSIVGSDNGDRPGGFVLVIDGAALDQALADEKNKGLLLRLATMCEGVICCRTSPLQKALVVRMVKEGLGVMTLAIGDGANDVSMIQSADVGVGIAGEEGLQAVNASDYAIAQFRFLKRLILVHGHWSYARNGNMILNFFYKNIVCIGVLWWFQIYCAWSSTYVFEYTYILFWNSFWTLCPVIAIGLFDRIVDANILMAVPELYRYGREGKWFGLRLFSIYMFDGILQSAIIFFLILYAYMTVSARPDGWQVNLYEFSTTMVFSAAIVANLYNGLNTNVWTGWVYFAVFIGIGLLWVYTAVYAAISPGWFSTPVFGYNHILWPSAFFWLCMPLTVCISLAPRYLAKAWKFGYAPNDIDIMRYIRKMEPDRDVVKEAYFARGSIRPLPRASSSRRTSRTSFASGPLERPSIDPRSGSRTDMSTGVRSIHRGFDFSTEEGGVAMQRMQTNLTERRQSSRDVTTTTQDNTNRNRRPGTLGHVFSVRRGFLRKKPSVAEGQ